MIESLITLNVCVKRFSTCDYLDYIITSGLSAVWDSAESQQDSAESQQDSAEPQLYIVFFIFYDLYKIYLQKQILSTVE